MKPRKKNYMKPKPSISKKGKNTRFIQRSKQSLESHRKQYELEKTYCVQTFETLEADDIEETLISENHKNELLELLGKGCDDNDIYAYTSASTFNSSEKQNSALIAKTNLMNKKTEQQFIEVPLEINENNCDIIEDDLFSEHFDNDLSHEEALKLIAYHENSKKVIFEMDVLGKLSMELVLRQEDNFSKQKGFIDRSTFCLKQSELIKIFKLKIARNLPSLSMLQIDSFAILNNYQDIYLSNNTSGERIEIRIMYCLHALNHILKTWSRIKAHNAEIKTMKKDELLASDNFRDQGLTRPKVLFVVPFRNSALQLVNTMIQLLSGDTQKPNDHAINYKRFLEEFSGSTLHFPKTNRKPEDYERTFAGNIDDNFRIGVALTKKNLKLYTDFYSSDIIIASPLGLRSRIGATESEDQDYDYLNSIEILVIDEAETIYAQNWENLLYVLEHLHLPPRSIRNTDVQRVRTWSLNGFSKFYRQTLLLASHELPEFRALFNNKCFNYRGKIQSNNPVMHGEIKNGIVPVPQIFQYVNVSTLDTSFEYRFNYFIKEILPKFRGPSFAHCLVYVPSYFDYVRIRNYFKAEAISFVQVCEYSKKEKIARARDMFFHSAAHFLLYSERSHYFRRTRIKGIRHIIMYQPPSFPNFYSEMINLMHESNQNHHDCLQNSMSVTVMFSKYDILQLGAILGTDTAANLIQSGKISHTFTTAPQTF